LLQRLPLSLPYPAVTTRIIDLMRGMPHGTTLVVDRTGAHGPTDELVAAGLSPIGITITSGESVNWSGRNVSVPKAALVTKLVSIAQGGDLEVHGDLPDWPELRRQLQNFRALITPGGRETWAAARGHDDLVIATAMAVWFLEGRNSPGFGLFESVRLAAGGAPETFCLAVDFGQSVDPCAICAMARLPAIDRPNREKFEPVLPTVSVDPEAPDNRTEWRKRFDDMAARQTPDHPDVGTAGETVHINGRLCKPTYAVGSAEWQQQQGDADA
jgi:hypothetical protein